MRTFCFIRSSKPKSDRYDAPTPTTTYAHVSRQARERCTQVGSEQSNNEVASMPSWNMDWLWHGVSFGLDWRLTATTKRITRHAEPEELLCRIGVHLLDRQQFSTCALSNQEYNFNCCYTKPLLSRLLVHRLHFLSPIHKFPPSSRIFHEVKLTFIIILPQQYMVFIFF